MRRGGKEPGLSLENGKKNVFQKKRDFTTGQKCGKKRKNTQNVSRSQALGSAKIVRVKWQGSEAAFGSRSKNKF